MRKIWLLGHVKGHPKATMFDEDPNGEDRPEILCGIPITEGNTHMLLGRDLEPGECVGPLLVMDEKEHQVYLDEIDTVSDALNIMTKECDKHRWIPVEERLLDELKDVRVTIEEKDGTRWSPNEGASLKDGKWFFNDYFAYEIEGKVIAWQPLPEPYKPESRGGDD